jgi:hypothetical protein
VVAPRRGGGRLARVGVARLDPNLRAGLLKNGDGPDMACF